MAVLMRHKSNIYGLVNDLTKLTNDIATEVTRASTVEGSLSSLSTTDKTNLVTAINEVLSLLQAQASSLADDLAAESARAIAAEGVLTTNLSTEVSDRIAGDIAIDSRLDVIEAGLVAGVFWKASFDTIEDLENAIDGIEGTVEAGWAYYVKSDNDGYVVVPETDGDYQPASWTTKSLIKFADYTEVSGLVSTERARALAAEGQLNIDLSSEITRATNAETALQNSISAEVTRATTAESVLDGKIATEKSRAEAAEALKLAIASNLSDLANIATARTNIDVYSKAETNEGIRLGGAIFVTETVSVSSDKIVLTNEPKNGIVFNFATVRHVDANFVSYDIPVSVTATAGGKEFLLSADASGQFDGKSVIVQYAYVPVA